MVTATFGRLVPPTQTLISRDDASEILGSISMAAFLCLLLPQLAANYRLKSADSLSMAFLFIWLLGDVTNLLGGLANHIAPASIAVTGYLCFSDTTLICQCLYYNSKQRISDPPDSTTLQAHDRQPLLGPSLSARDPRASGQPQEIDSESAITLQDDKKTLVQAVRTLHDWRFNLACILAVQLLGVTGWFVLRTVGLLGGDNKPPGSVSITDAQGISESVGSALGVVGAICYLCARIPQIIKNYRGKSCEGLAPLFLLLSITGNLTYGLSVIAYRQDRDYLLTSLPWLMGSLGTILEDVIILLQVRLYSQLDRPSQQSSI
ncbi:PQ loop repeat-domain-containing protein [Colletotrichum navitas]|uniref:PQ loop repeat-domain-containing protein n=1 Tax=Colletotrichum navitas TaxID=681940 RepID=A0AAD8PSQ5_9PEZI|nr:PQ loop repeat-domain-containing protein [Colletotrichum navitas]KAK1579347.1 PQ loop repeat-domain-containing protein [Colletotrichum navitas]